MSDSKDIINDLSLFLKQVKGQEHFDQVCFRATQIALGVKGVSSHDCNPTLRSSKRLDCDVSGELGKSNRRIVNYQPLEPSSSLESISATLQQHPRQGIEQSGYIQPSKIHGRLVLITPPGDSDDQDSHIFAILSSSTLPRVLMRDAKKNNAPHLVVDTTQNNAIFTATSEGLATYIKAQMDDGYGAGLYTVGSGREKKQKK